MTNAFTEYGTISDGGEVGGDAQAGSAYCRAFIRKNDNGTHTFAEITAYPSNEFSEEVSGGYDIQEQTYVATIPNGIDVHDESALWNAVAEHDGEYEYAYPFDRSWSTVEDAEVVARNHIANINPAHLA